VGKEKRPLSPAKRRIAGKARAPAGPVAGVRGKARSGSASEVGSHRRGASDAYIVPWMAEIPMLLTCDHLPPRLRLLSFTSGYVPGSGSHFLESAQMSV